MLHSGAGVRWKTGISTKAELFILFNQTTLSFGSCPLKISNEFLQTPGMQSRDFSSSSGVPSIRLLYHKAQICEVLYFVYSFQRNLIDAEALCTSVRVVLGFQVSFLAKFLWGWAVNLPLEKSRYFHILAIFNDEALCAPLEFPGFTNLYFLTASQRVLVAKYWWGNSDYIFFSI